MIQQLQNIQKSFQYFLYCLYLYVLTETLKSLVEGTMKLQVN